MSSIGSFVQPMWLEVKSLFVIPTSLDIHCIVAACLFVVSNVLILISGLRYHSRGHFDYQLFKQLDPTFIQEEWDYREKYTTYHLVSGLINALTWFALCIPVIKVAWIQSMNGKYQLGIHVTIVILAIGGSFTEMLARIFSLGTNGVSSWIASDFNLQNWTAVDSNDMIGWRALEISYMISSNITLWVDAVEWLFLCGIMILFFVSIVRPTNDSSASFFSTHWAYFGAIIGILCAIDFSSSILRYQSWRFFSSICLFVGFINRAFLIPLWLLWLGKQLPIAEENLCGNVPAATEKTSANPTANVVVPDEEESAFT